MMDSFGRAFRLSIFGESHGESVGVVVEGCPAGIEISEDMFQSDLERRKGGMPGTTPRVEADVPAIRSGLFEGRATGAPICIEFANRNVRSQDYVKLRNTPRPGHADLTAFQKYGGFNDFRGGGRFSGRLTVPFVAAGVIAKKILEPVQVEAVLVSVAGQSDEQAIQESVAKTRKEGDSLGGIVECRARGLPPGLGEPFFDSVESLLAHAVFSIPGIKGVEFGAGFSCATMKGSELNDPILDARGKTASNHSGGVNGGLTNGNELVFRVAVRPPASIRKPQATIDLETGRKTSLTVTGRHDACIALRAPVILEAATAIVLADLSLLEQKVSRVAG